MARHAGTDFIIGKIIIIIFFIIVIIIIGFTAFHDRETVVNSIAPKNVATQKVEEKGYAISLDYRGIVQPYETKKYAFPLGGKVEKIYVKKGQEIHPGDILAKLDTETLELNSNTAAQYVKSLENSIRLSKSYLDAMEPLYKEGAIPSKELEAKQTEYQNLLNSYEIAKNSLNEATEVLNNAVLYSDMSGYVMELPFKEGEITAMGNPVVIGKSEGVKAVVGVSVEDYAKITTESAVWINEKIKGKISSISAFPDEENMLYTVDIIFDSDDIAVGETIDVQIIIGEDKGCFIPIESVFNLDGIDYVYTVSEEGAGNWKVNKQQVRLHEIRDDNIRVTGLKAGTQIVTSGVKSLKENDMVNIVNAERAVNQ
ncbi:RND family efflux transporter, MFP subunit [Desulfosporosinus orientis DSM 765]|uniref:RND family efflux transporter, MFP subunit n=1 Tax=Desulfosporosinus orientis (strain ATCC 19365 / DSM 765 / NCIMB 8382 / VKM B-1628 / Singapore I) TaxID=768706 RepID=G7W912_DESOD|nr:efflux RND transporter periplasmic adaptor subunit [Desulfosporosinus orientis]AET68221.1 RND family efflux transporter, MFP subunit [Desulfosporosinus orientis DSM 765]